MANTEKREPQTHLHCLLAFRRRKDNPEGPVTCFREIIRDEPTDMERLKVKLRKVPGKWRIHRTVNARDVAKAARILQHRLLDNPEDAGALETVWKTCLLQKASRGERNILIDIDDPTCVWDVGSILDAMGVVASASVRTPSGGYHVVCASCDTREIEALPDVSIVRDGYLFLEEYET